MEQKKKKKTWATQNSMLCGNVHTVLLDVAMTDMSMGTGRQRETHYISHSCWYTDVLLWFILYWPLLHSFLLVLWLCVSSPGFPCSVEPGCEKKKKKYREPVVWIVPFSRDWFWRGPNDATGLASHWEKEGKTEHSFQALRLGAGWCGQFPSHIRHSPHASPSSKVKTQIKLVILRVFHCQLICWTLWENCGSQARVLSLNLDVFKMSFHSLLVICSVIST